MANQPKRPQHRPIDNNYGHLQPQAPDIEKIVLGALMIDKDAFTIVGEILHPETFTNHVIRRFIAQYKSLILTSDL